MATERQPAQPAAGPAAVLARPDGPRDRLPGSVRRRASSRSAAFLVHNTLVNLRRQNIATGFGFLDREAAFGIGESLIPYSPADTYARAFLVGLLNTLYVAGARHRAGDGPRHRDGHRAAVEQLAGPQAAQIYVETFRNIPLLLQLFFWWALLRESAPAPRQAWQPLPGVFVSNRGIDFPVPRRRSGLWLDGCSRFVGGARRRRRGAALGEAAPGADRGSSFRRAGSELGLVARAAVASCFSPPARRCASIGPSCKGFNFAGGHAVSPEFAALLIGLVVYTGSLYRRDRARRHSGGQLGPERGGDGARAAARGRRCASSCLPQALRVIIPPMTSQYLSLTKNSSLAVAIGYPDLVSIANTTMNQTGQAVEGIAMIMAVYLVDQPDDLAVDEPLQPLRRAGGALAR